MNKSKTQTIITANTNHSVWFQRWFVPLPPSTWTLPDPIWIPGSPSQHRTATRWPRERLLERSGISPNSNTLYIMLCSQAYPLCDRPWGGYYFCYVVQVQTQHLPFAVSLTHTQTHTHKICVKIISIEPLQFLISTTDSDHSQRLLFKLVL